MLQSKVAVITKHVDVCVGYREVTNDMNIADGEDIMAYDFDKIVDRSNTNSMKWNVAEGELPMWVADMDFETAPAIMEAISKRAQHGCFAIQRFWMHGIRRISTGGRSAMISQWRRTG